MAHGLGPEAPYVCVRIMNERHAEALRDDARIECAAPRGVLRKGHADVALAGTLRFERPPGAGLERLRIDFKRGEDHRDSPDAIYRRLRSRRSSRAFHLQRRSRPLATPRRARPDLPVRETTQIWGT